MPPAMKVAPLPEYRLHVEFDDGVSAMIDLSGELDGEVFRALRDEAVFRQVTVDELGAVCWPNGPDPDAMHSDLAGEPGAPIPTAAGKDRRLRRCEAARRPVESPTRPCRVYPLFCGQIESVASGWRKSPQPGQVSRPR
jgi:hypothetical protein